MKKKPKTYWCGYFNGRPHMSHVCDGIVFGGIGTSLFKNKKDAVAQGFQEVRKVKIVEVK